MASQAAQRAGARIMADNEVREWIRFACECNGVDGLEHKIRIEWSNRLTRSMGNCGRDRWSDICGRSWVVKLSVPLFSRATTEERYNTIIHEVCHAIDDYLNGRMDPLMEGHGPKWQKVMRACGITPTRYHNVDTKGLRNQHEYECPTCGKLFKLSTRLHNQIRRGRNRICLKCRETIKYTGRSGKGI